MKLLASYIKLPLRDKGLYVEAFIWLGLARLLLLFVSFRHIAVILGKLHGESLLEEQPATQKKADRIGITIRTLSRYIPWRCQCLEQSLAGRMMLGLRGLPATVYFGVKLSKNGKFGAHAWLRCGRIDVTGNIEEGDIKKLASFSSS